MVISAIVDYVIDVRYVMCRGASFFEHSAAVPSCNLHRNSYQAVMVIFIVQINDAPSPTSSRR